METAKVQRVLCWLTALAVLTAVVLVSRLSYVAAVQGLPAWGGEESYVHVYSGDFRSYIARKRVLFGLTNIYQRGSLLICTVVGIGDGSTPDVDVARAVCGCAGIVLCVAMLLLGYRAGGLWWGLALFALATFYPPLVGAAQVVSTGHLAAFLVAIGMALVCSESRLAPLRTTAGLLCLVLAFLDVPSLYLLAPAVAVYRAAAAWRTRAQRPAWATTAGILWFLLIAAGVVWGNGQMRTLLAQQVRSGYRPELPTMGHFAWAYLESGGIPTDAGQPDAEYAKGLATAALSERGVSLRDHLRLGLGRVFQQPLRSGCVLLNNMDRLWRRPPTLFGQPWGLTYPNQQRLHWVFVGLAAAGMLVRVAEPSLRAARGVAALVVLYGTVIGGLTTVWPTSSLPVLPAFFLLVGVGCHSLLGAFRSTGENRTALSAAIACGFGVWLVWLLPARLWLPPLFFSGPVTLSLQVLGLLGVLLVALCGGLLWWNRTWGMAWRGAVGGCLLIVVGGGVISRLADNPNALRWETALDGRNRAVRQWIDVPVVSVARADRAAVWLDCRAPEQLQWITVDVNGTPIKRAHARTALDLTRFHSGTDALARSWNSRVPVYRWAGFPVPLGVLRDQPTAEVVIRQTYNAPRNVALCGDYDTPFWRPRRAYEGPGFPLQPADRSLALYLATLAEYRLPARLILAGRTSPAARRGPQRWDGADLSPALGRQNGRYRVFLALGQLNELVWETPVIHEATPAHFCFLAVAGPRSATATLSLNGVERLTFATGLDTDRRWFGAGVTLDYDYQQRVENTVNGMYCLLVPPELLLLGQPQTLAIRPESGSGGGYLPQEETWLFLADIRRGVAPIVDRVFGIAAVRARVIFGPGRFVAAHGPSSSGEERELRSLIGRTTGRYVPYGCQWAFY